MGFQDNALQAGFQFIIVVIPLFSLASFGTSLYAIFQAFKWLDDFVQISGRGSHNWNWTVIIVVLLLGGLCANCGTVTYTYIRRTKCSCYVILWLFGASILHLSITAPARVAVRKCRWAEVLRRAGHADHAYHVDVFYNFVNTAIILWSVIGSICFIMVISRVVTALLHRRSMRNRWDEYNQRKQHPLRLQAEPDMELGNNGQADQDTETSDDRTGSRRPRSLPLTLNPTFTEGGNSRW